MNKIPGTLSAEVEGQGACDHEPLPEAVHGFHGVIPKVTADVVNPFPHKPETLVSLGYACDIKIRD